MGHLSRWAFNLSFQVFSKCSVRSRRCFYSYFNVLFIFDFIGIYFFYLNSLLSMYRFHFGFDFGLVYHRFNFKCDKLCVQGPLQPNRMLPQRKFSSPSPSSAMTKFQLDIVFERNRSQNYSNHRQNLSSFIT